MLIKYVMGHDSWHKNVSNLAFVENGKMYSKYVSFRFLGLNDVLTPWQSVNTIVEFPFLEAEVVSLWRLLFRKDCKILFSY